MFNFRNFLRRYHAAADGTTLVNMCIAAVLFLLGALVVFEALRVWRRARLDAAAGFPLSAARA